MGQLEKYKELVGTLFDERYRIEQLVGLGGMAVVYKATDTKTGKTVAIKKLKDSIAAESDAQNRFYNEARAVSMLSHPNIVGIYESCLNRPEKYLVMEYVEGISLRTYMDRRKVLSFEETVSYAEQILAALDCAHKAGVVHRDIKPQNILLLKNGIVKVTDFGIAKTPETGEEAKSNGGMKNENAIGTVYYISPEQAEGGESDHRSDLYSLGVMMYEMATGRLPFYDDQAAEVLMMHMEREPDSPRSINRDIPRGLQELILCAMEKHPKKRYQSALDMFRELRKLKKRKKAAVLTPAQIKREKRSARNRERNTPSRSLTPVILGVAFALLTVAIVAGFTALDRLKIGNLASVSITVPDATGRIYDWSFAADSKEYEAQLKDLGLETGYNVSVTYVYSDVAGAGTIVSQNPIAGSSRKTPCDITLTVSLGPEKVALENYTRMDWRLAYTALQNAGFRVVEKYENNPIILGGYVVGTVPAAGTLVQKGSVVELHISSTTADGTLVVPDFVGFSEPLVVTKLKDVGLELGSVTYTRSTQDPGKILVQSPEPGKTVFGGSAVNFVVSGGPDYVLNYYPDVTGMAESEAVALLEKLGLTVHVTAAKSAEVKGTVLVQSPAAGTQTQDMQEVWLTVSSGEDYAVTVTMFDVLGNRVEDAELLLQAAFRTVYVEVTREMIADRAAVGTVIAQSIEDGAIVVVTDGVLRVTLTVSGGPDYVPEEITTDPDSDHPSDPSENPSTPRAEGTTVAPAVTTIPEVTVLPEITTRPEETTAPEVPADPIGSGGLPTPPEG